jgi:hypothetical protein
MPLPPRLKFGFVLLALLITGNVLLVINDGITWRTAVFGLPTVTGAVGLWFALRREKH